mmetsp:Transcript_16787/g.45902  ORF Transcript_16787/g.45902 Transcript_16787/m.45902 type:complete len:265 (+) Transcript_16787:269-1063(+)
MDADHTRAHGEPGVAHGMQKPAHIFLAHLVHSLLGWSRLSGRRLLLRELVASPGGRSLSALVFRLLVFFVTLLLPPTVATGLSPSPLTPAARLRRLALRALLGRSLSPRAVLGLRLRDPRLGATSGTSRASLGLRLLPGLLPRLLGVVPCLSRHALCTTIGLLVFISASRLVRRGRRRARRRASFASFFPLRVRRGCAATRARVRVSAPSCTTPTGRGPTVSVLSTVGVRLPPGVLLPPCCGPVGLLGLVPPRPVILGAVARRG